jgi:tetrapyrrole methylase family protein/MazG family protein
MIKIVGLGPGSREALTLGTLECLEENKNLFFRTEKHPTVDYIKTKNIDFETFDFAYDKFESFDDVYKYIAEELCKKHDKLKQIVYAVPGHPLVAEKSVDLLIQLCKDKSIEVEILPAVSFIDAVMEAINLDPIKSLKVIDSFNIKEQIPDTRSNIIITQVYNNLIASEVKLWLLDNYDDEKEIYFIRAAGVKGQEIIKKIPIYELDRQKEIDYLTSIVVPKDSKKQGFYDLLDIMEKLRSKDGCPWDIEQTHESVKRCVVEESYELVEAIENEDYDTMIEELGDVLFQVIFHAQIGKEDGFFNINDVIEGICDKMIRRHPHVFGNINVKNTNEVLNNWETIKMEEKRVETNYEEMERVAKTLPALIRAEKIQKKAKKVGFDLVNIEDALNKVKEEFSEVKNVYKTEEEEKILEEIGDLLFSCVNVARFLKVDPEDALNKSSNKFIQRFSCIEKSAINKGLSLESMTLEEMDEIWNKAKK